MQVIIKASKHKSLLNVRYFILQWGAFKRKTSGFRFWKEFLKVKLRLTVLTGGVLITFHLTVGSLHSFTVLLVARYQPEELLLLCCHLVATPGLSENNKKKLRWFWLLTCKYGNKDESRITVIVNTFKTTLDQPVITTKWKHVKKLIKNTFKLLIDRLHRVKTQIDSYSKVRKLQIN